jgi:hypothetical protein
VGEGVGESVGEGEGNNRYLSKSFWLLLMKGDMDEPLLLKYFTFLLQKNRIC